MRILTTLPLTLDVFVSKCYLSSPKSGKNGILVFLGCYVPRTNTLYVGGACPIFVQCPHFQCCFIVLSMLFYYHVNLAIIHSQSQPSSFFSIWYQYWFYFFILPGAKNYTLLFFIPGEGNGNPLQYSCLENPRDWRTWCAAVYGVAQSWTWLKWLSSSSSFFIPRHFLFFLF